MDWVDDRTERSYGMGWPARAVGLFRGYTALPMPGSQTPKKPDPWTLVTASDERLRCMVVQGGARCNRRSAWISRPSEGVWMDDYAIVCQKHVNLVRDVGYVVERLPR